MIGAPCGLLSYKKVAGSNLWPRVKQAGWNLWPRVEPTTESRTHDRQSNFFPFLPFLTGFLGSSSPEIWNSIRKQGTHYTLVQTPDRSEHSSKISIIALQAGRTYDGDWTSESRTHNRESNFFPFLPFLTMFLGSSSPENSNSHINHVMGSNFA